MKLPITLPLYWKCQLIGWSITALYWGMIGFIGTNFSLLVAAVHFNSDLLIYILPTHLFRTFSLRHNWQNLQPKKLLIKITPIVLGLGLAFMFLTISKSYLVRVFFEPNFSESFQQYISQAWLITYVTGIRLMSIWVLAYYLYHYAQREIQALNERNQLAIIAKDAQLNNLATQLNPHFFFNSLNNIKALVLENPQASRRAIDQLADLLRISLSGTATTWICLQEEIALISDYLELETMRFEKRLQTKINVDERLSGALILPLSIQSLVENAIKHGIALQKAGGIIQIKIIEKDGYIQTTVQNPGTLKIQQTKGLGLKNLKERLQLQFNGKADFSLTQQPDKTVLATLIMPLQLL